MSVKEEKNALIINISSFFFILSYHKNTAIHFVQHSVGGMSVPTLKKKIPIKSSQQHCTFAFCSAYFCYSNLFFWCAKEGLQAKLILFANVSTCKKIMYVRNVAFGLLLEFSLESTLPAMPVLLFCWLHAYTLPFLLM